MAGRWFTASRTDYIIGGAVAQRGLGGAAPNCEATQLFWRESGKSQGFGGRRPQRQQDRFRITSLFSVPLRSACDGRG